MALTTIGTVANKLRSFLSNFQEAGSAASLVERPDNSLAIQQANASGHALVEVATAALPTDAATQTTLAQIAGASVPPTSNGAITKSDSTVYSPPLRWLQCTGAGVVRLVLSGSANTLDVTFASGERETGLLISKVMSTGTTATGISGAA